MCDLMVFIPDHCLSRVVGWCDGAGVVGWCDGAG